MSVILKSEWLDTPLGKMIAVVDEKVLYLLEFEGRVNLEKGLKRLEEKMQSMIVPGRTEVTTSIEHELYLYFGGKLREFKTPFVTIGTVFQKRVWKELQKVSFGRTSSYSEIANKMGEPTAFRAVAGANGANRLAIVIPCHRVIYAQGTLGGYAGGLEHKHWLLNHEKTAFKAHVEGICS
jgi:AraC family transcriptional regulator of adaptative response/methylated-DNA-[protein]-cysteine methyltransferase